MNLLKIANIHPTIVTPKTTVSESIKEMVNDGVGAVLVVVQNKLIGIFTERDLMVRVIYPGLDPVTTKVSDVMATPVESIGPGKKAVDALTLMIERHFRHLPITDEDGNILGMLSIRHLLRAQVEYLSHELNGLEAYMTADGFGG